jgi:hypothetical protein
VGVGLEVAGDVVVRQGEERGGCDVQRQHGSQQPRSRDVQPPAQQTHHFDYTDRPLDRSIDGPGRTRTLY